ncbi:MAG: SLBB domain-containing protein, partial [candidate division Zixibacteria bacterium]
MRKLVFFIVPVIIIVSLHWFSEAKAQDLSKLSAADKAALMQKYAKSGKNSAGSSKPLATDESYYESSQIFDSARSPAYPDRWQQGDSLSSDSAAESDKLSDSLLIEFDDLLPFGTDLFSSPREETPPDDIASAGDYLLGPGDKLIVYLWGRVEKEMHLTVDRDGKVFIPKVGTMQAWGRTLAEFEVNARNKFGTVYSEFSLSISLGAIRSIRVYLTGEVHRPGAYTVSSLTSLFNALYLAGGPTENGSMRSIRLMRSGKAVAEADLYRFLLKGDNSSDVRLRTGDAIFVPVTGPRVAIRGEIRREAIYELRGKETASDLLELAGGPKAEAHLERVMLERIGILGEWEIIDLNLTSEVPENSPGQSLADGDRVTIYPIFENKLNMVSVFGQVKHPGYYERTDSTHISDLVAAG